ncbi:MAG: hypothetical protein Q8916_01690 [Bacteroidota bacterium]|nr:hypothetical protein [Bacteroidota bacterium]MDP4229099.1 hypothetical protein [Bacteroidota bacterium]MDP4235027.1 hypothetical protein [Bacteroidota bacterium]
MNRYLSILSFVILLSACSKKEDKPANASDSLLSKPMTVDPIPEAQKKDTASGLLIDQARFRSPEHEALLQRFEVYDVVNIYHDFKSIRKPGITQAQIDSFDKAKKISVDELKAVLEEGDRLGWSKH